MHTSNLLVFGLGFVSVVGLVALLYRIYKFELRKCSCGSWTQRIIKLFRAKKVVVNKKFPDANLGRRHYWKYGFNYCPKCDIAICDDKRLKEIKRSSLWWKMRFARRKFLMALRHDHRIFKLAREFEPQRFQASKLQGKSETRLESALRKSVPGIRFSPEGSILPDLAEFPRPRVKAR